MQSRYYGSKVNLPKLRPVVSERIKNRTNNYIVRNMTAVAFDVLKARSVLTEGVSSLLEVFPIKSCNFMASKQKVQHYFTEGISPLMQLRYYSSKVNLPKLRPVVIERIKNRANNYIARNMAPVAYDVLKARSVLTDGVSSLLEVFPIKSCKFCPEVYIGNTGHQIKTCHGSKRIIKDRVHQWTDGNLNDILIPLVTYHHQNFFHDATEHDQKFDRARIPAIVELCHQSGAKISANNLDYDIKTVDGRKVGSGESVTLLPKEVSQLAQRTLAAWEMVRSGVGKLLLACPVNICEYCSEVHVGTSEYKARLYEVMNRSCRGSHRWKKAGVDDLVPQKLVWHRRPHDPPILVDSGRCFYGRAPAVVGLCVQAGARVPAKYSAMMKSLGLSRT